MITYRPDFIAADLETLAAGIPFEQETLRMYGREIPVPRLTSWHGAGTYRFGGMTRPAKPLTATLEALRARVSEEVGVEFNSVLANLYRDGRDSVAWHADDEPEMGPTIASLSFGASRRFLIRAKGDASTTREFVLSSGSLLVMGGTLQETHEHSVPKTRKPVGARLNLTFRVRL